MEMEEAFKLAQSDTRFIRVRKNLLYTFGSTRLPYICISQSLEDGHAVVRQGEARAERPHIAFPGADFSFQGFEGLVDDAALDNHDEIAIVLARRISLPPSNYINEPGVSRKESGSVDSAIERAITRLENANDVRTAVIAAPEQVWGLSILLYVGSQVARSAQSNVSEHFERLRLQGGS